MFFSQTTFGSELKDVWKIIDLIEKNCNNGNDKVASKIIRYLNNFYSDYKENKQQQQLNLSQLELFDKVQLEDKDISILFLCLYYLFYFFGIIHSDYKFNIKYSIRHFYITIFDEFGYFLKKEEKSFY
jgi:hypothetical protein